MTSRIRKVADVVASASGFVSGSSTWREEIDNLREMNRWDDALELYKKLAKEKDPSTEILILGQKSFSSNDIDSAKKSWLSIVNDDYPAIVKMEAYSLLCILEHSENMLDNTKEYSEKVNSYISSVDENILKDQGFTSYRFSILLECLLIKAATEPENAVNIYHLIEKNTLQFFYLKGSICDKAKSHYETAIFEKIILSDNSRLQLLEWREALSSPINCSEKHKIDILNNISNTCLYEFNCNHTQYPNTKDFGLLKEPFIPSCAIEEGILASLLSESIDNVNIDNYDNIIFCFGTQNALEYAIGPMERAVAVNTENLHLWSQLAFCLLNTGKALHSFTIVQQILEVTPNDVLMLLLGAKICINYLNDIKTASQYCNIAIKICSDIPKYNMYLGRSYHYFGLCYSISAVNIFSIERKKIHTKAIEYYQQAIISGCNDYLLLFHFGLEYAEIGNIIEAKKYVKQSLQLNEDYISSWLLLILLLTSQKLYEEAIEICNIALLQFDDIKLLYCSANIYLQMKDYNNALLTAKLLFEKCEIKNDTEIYTNTQPKEQLLLLSPRLKQQDDYSEPKSQYSQKSDSCSTILESTVNIQNTILDSFDGWILLAQIYLELKKYDDCSLSLIEASKERPHDPNVFFWKGKLEQIQGNKENALTFYKNALCCDSNHNESTVQIAELLIDENIHEAENYATSATKKFPFSSKGWFLLGKILLKFNDKMAAISCMKLALNIEKNEPLLPFSWINIKL